MADETSAQASRSLMTKRHSFLARLGSLTHKSGPAPSIPAIRTGKTKRFRCPAKTEEDHEPVPPCLSRCPSFLTLPTPLFPPSPNLPRSFFALLHHLHRHKCGGGVARGSPPMSRRAGLTPGDPGDGIGPLERVEELEPGAEPPQKTLVEIASVERSPPGGPSAPPPPSRRRGSNDDAHQT